jgi:hypothetical protein
MKCDLREIKELAEKMQAKPRKGFAVDATFLGPIWFSHFFDSWKQHRSGEGG